MDAIHAGSIHSIVVVTSENKLSLRIAKGKHRVMGFKKKSTGRNELCPCGSGLKYKKCCLNNNAHALQPTNIAKMPDAVNDAISTSPDQVSSSTLSSVGGFNPVPGKPGSDASDIGAAMAGMQFESLEQAQAFANQFFQERNSTPLPEFHGISPEQMHRMIHAPLDSPSLITLENDYEVSSKVPFVMFYEHLMAAVADGKLKPTAKGNLPRGFSRDMAKHYWGDAHSQETRYRPISSEEDFRPLNAFRHTCEFAGGLRKYKGKFIIGSRYQKLMKTGGLPTIYQDLFNTFNREFNWAAFDGYAELPHLQHSWAFSLHLLQQYGKQWRPCDFYEDAILSAFPALVDEAGSTSYMTAEKHVKLGFRHRVINHWMKWFGLAELRHTKENDFLSNSLELRKTELADRIVEIHLS